MAAPAVSDRTDHLRAQLDAFLDQVDWEARRAQDPVSIVWAYDDDDDREVAALVTACLAYGQVRLLRRAATRCLAVLGHSPAQALREGVRADALQGFVYRMTRGEDVAALFRAVGAALVEHGSLQALFRAGWSPDHPDYRPALTHFVGALRARGQSTSRGFHYLLPDPAKGGACKRLNLFLRWMIRGPDAIDLGIWALPTQSLVMPLDTHITRIARYLALCTRKSADWKLAVEIRNNLAMLDPSDPLKYDFALCHLGISGQCPRRRDPVLCVGCPIQSVCTL